jgi:hypothetical protein
MGFWKTVTIEGKPKFWDKPNCRWKLGPLGDEALIEFHATQADYGEVNAAPDTVELTFSQARALSESWGDTLWVYPTAAELYGIGYCSVSDLRDRGITPEMATDDEVRTAIQRAKELIDAFCNRNFWRREATYSLDGEGTPSVFLDDRPVIAVLALKVDGDTLHSYDYKVYGDSGYIKLVRGVFPEGPQNVEVFGQFGFAVIPSEVRRASLELSIDTLREIKTEIDLAEAASNSTRNAVGLKRAKIEDISVEFEYPRSVTGDTRRVSTGSQLIDSMLLKFRKDMDITVV